MLKEAAITRLIDMTINGYEKETSYQHRYRLLRKVLSTKADGHSISELENMLVELCWLKVHQMLLQDAGLK